MLVLPLLALGCNRQSPTEPTSSSPKIAAASADTTGNAATGGTVIDKSHGGNGGGNGQGHGGNGGGNGHGHGGDLSLQIDPSTWNTNWVNASGNVQAFVRGSDAGKIDLGSIVLVGDGGKTLDPRATRYAGGQVVATFSKSDAFKLLDSPKPGDQKTVTLRFNVGTGSSATKTELTDSVRIVGDGGGDDGGGGQGETSLQIQPDDWNTNWQHSSGQVHAFLRGGDLSQVDLTTVRLVGDKTGADPVKPLDVRLVGHQIAARFSQSAAFATLNDPHAGERHTVKITFKADGKSVELSDVIHVVGRP
ncbi:MAG: hypothetical protein DMF53_05140 [Acidobacteria bacterium]|nr:MAG: hypothetical protein DMF53_05140 [Acidobacteriota bacterium]